MEKEGGYNEKERERERLLLVSNLDDNLRKHRESQVTTCTRTCMCIHIAL